MKLMMLAFVKKQNSQDKILMNIENIRFEYFDYIMTFKASYSY